MTPVPDDLPSSLAHTLAGRLSQQASRDAREWLVEVRGRARDL